MLWLALALAADPTTPEVSGPPADPVTEPIVDPAADPAAPEPDAPTAPAAAADPDAPAGEAEAVGSHTLIVAVKSPPAGTVIEATAFGETRELRDPGVGVHSTSFVGLASRFTRLELALSQNGVRTPVYDGIVPLSDAETDTVSFVVTGGTRPTALRTTYAPSAAVRLWTEPVTFTRYGWAAVLALYGAMLLFATTRRA